MKKITTAVLTGLLIMSPVAVTPVQASVVTHSIKGSSEVKVPKAVPGQFCKKVHRKKHTHTKRYGVLKCKPEGNRSRWRR